MLETDKKEADAEQGPFLFHKSQNRTSTFRRSLSEVLGEPQSVLTESSWGGLAGLRRITDEALPNPNYDTIFISIFAAHFCLMDDRAASATSGHHRRSPVSSSAPSPRWALLLKPPTSATSSGHPFPPRQLLPRQICCSGRARSPSWRAAAGSARDSRRLRFPRFHLGEKKQKQNTKISRLDKTK